MNPDSWMFFSDEVNQSLSLMREKINHQHKPDLSSNNIDSKQLCCSTDSHDRKPQSGQEHNHHKDDEQAHTGRPGEPALIGIEAFCSVPVERKKNGDPADRETKNSRAAKEEDWSGLDERCFPESTKTEARMQRRRHDRPCDAGYGGGQEHGRRRRRRKLAREKESRHTAAGCGRNQRRPTLARLH
jgi:hypothetical protein